MALGLLIGSAKTYYDTQSNELTQASADVALLGRLLHYYGPEANGAKESLRLAVGQVLRENWPSERSQDPKLSLNPGYIQEVYEKLRFSSVGVYFRANTISVTTFFVAALCVSGAIFLILELYTPYKGCCVSPAPRSGSPMILFRGSWF